MQFEMEIALGLSCYTVGMMDRGSMCGITYQTVRHHLQAIRLKLSARNTTHAVLLTLTQNLILLEDGHEAEKVVGG